jgi:hypothetical protein
MAEHWHNSAASFRRSIPLHSQIGEPNVGAYRAAELWLAGYDAAQRKQTST